MRRAYSSGSKRAGDLKPPPETVTVTRAQFRAAQIMVKRREQRGEHVSPATRAIANAKKEAPVVAKISDDCMCENNDPECAECWWTPGGVKIAPDSLTFLMQPPPVYADVKQTDLDVDYLKRCGIVGPGWQPPPPVFRKLDGDEKDTFKFDVTTRFQECEALLLRKHKDYGPSNIGNAPGGPLNGLRVRMHDKLARINHLLDSGVEPSNESLRDSLADLCNYSLIGLCVVDGVWPKE